MFKDFCGTLEPVSYDDVLIREQRCDFERERRAKAAYFYNELSRHVCKCSKPRVSQLNILRNVKEELNKTNLQNNRNSPRSFLNIQQLEHLFLQAANDVLIVIECHSGNIVFVSDKLKALFGYSQEEWLQKWFFSFIHSDDYDKVFNILAMKSSNNQLPKKFSCRIRIPTGFIDANVTGYYKTLSSNGEKRDYLYGVIRRFVNEPKPESNDLNEFSTRLDKNGVIKFVDKCVSGLLGYQPADMLKKPLTDFCIQQDQALVKDQLKMVCENKTPQSSPVQMTVHIPFCNNPSNIVKFKTSAYAFCNPCNDAFEFIVCTHTSQPPSGGPGQMRNESTDNFFDFDFFSSDFWSSFDF